MRITLFRTIITFFALLIGIGLTLFWIFYPQIPDIPVPDTNIGCNFADTSKCQISKEDKKFWEEKILSRFKEKHLEKYESEESYRLVLQPTFDKPLLVQISTINNQKVLMIKKLSGEGGFGLEKFGKLSYEKNKPLSESEWNNSIRLINEMSFFNTSSITDEDPVPDGAFWTLEGKKGNFTHQVQRITPDEKFREVINHFLRIAEVEKEYEGY